MSVPKTETLDDLRRPVLQVVRIESPPISPPWLDRAVVFMQASNNSPKGLYVAFAWGAFLSIWVAVAIARGL